MRPTRSHAASSSVDFIHGLAPREVYRDCMNHFMHGGLLHRPFTLSADKSAVVDFLGHCAVSKVFSQVIILYFPVLKTSTGTLLFGVRTFLIRFKRTRSPGGKQI